MHQSLIYKEICINPFSKTRNFEQKDNFNLKFLNSKALISFRPFKLVYPSVCSCFFKHFPFFTIVTTRVSFFI